MKGLVIFVGAFSVGVALTRCSAQDQQLADRTVRDVCRVVTYDVDGGDPIRELVRAIDEIDRRRRDGGAP